MPCGSFSDQIIDAIQFAIQWVKNNWPLILAVLTGPIGMAIFAIWKFRDQIIEVFKKLADVVPDWLKSGISTAFEVVGNTAGATLKTRLALRRAARCQGRQVRRALP